MDGKQMSGREALIEVLRENGGRMKIKDATAEAVKRAPRMKGKTPTATLAAMIYTAAKKPGGQFRVPEKGVVELVENPAETPIAPVEQLDAKAATTAKDPGKAKPDPKPSTKAKPSTKKRTRSSGRRPRAAAAK